MGEIRVRAKMDELGVSLNELTREIADQLVTATAEVAQLTYNRAVEMASARLHSTKQQYLDALKLEPESEGVFVISLDASADHLEDGYPPFPMLPKLVNGPKSKVSKEGYRYVIVPIRTRTDTASTQPSENSRSVAMKLKQVIDMRKFKKVKSTVDAKSGKVTTVEKYSGEAPHPFLKGLTRVREYASADSKKPMSSAYLTFRVASEKQMGKGKWNHPGFQGANIFPDLERWADTQMTTIISDIFNR
jgi:hypothetical protein